MNLTPHPDNLTIKCESLSGFLWALTNLSFDTTLIFKCCPPLLKYSLIKLLKFSNVSKESASDVLCTIINGHLYSSKSSGNGISNIIYNAFHHH